ncbi:MAG: MFS transporter [Lautropia sp.]
MTSVGQSLRDFFAVSPLRHAPFRRFYLGSAGSALGFTMLVTASAWLMATLTPSALMVALVQSASTLPTLAFGLVAGSLADLVDRKRVILSTQVIMIASGVALGLLTMAGWMNPIGLLLLIFLLGTAFTFYLPAQSASINELVSRADLPRAVALGAVAFNLARAVGPALAGVIAAWRGTAPAMLFAAACFVAMLFGARSVKRPTIALPGVPETILSGVMTGVRFARHSDAMRSFLIRNLSFAACASALWALLPVIARDQLGFGAGGYGLLFGMFGGGAVVAAFLMPGQLQKRSLNTVVTFSVLVWTVAVLVVAASELAVVALAGAAGAGAAWVGTLASLGAGTQSTAPAWVRARAVSINLIAVQASLAIGSALWGALANVVGTQLTLAASAGAMLLLHVLNRKVRVELGEEADVTPYAQLPELGIKAEPMPNDGPVLVQMEYRIDPADETAFIHAIHAVEDTRRRNGASSWRVFRDLGEDGKFVERYIISSWAEYVRLRSRMTIADRRVQERVHKLQRPGIEIRISRLIGVDLDDVPDEDVLSRPVFGGVAPVPTSGAVVAGAAGPVGAGGARQGPGVREADGVTPPGGDARATPSAAADRATRD